MAGNEPGRSARRDPRLRERATSPSAARDGSVLRAPDTSIEAIRKRLGTEPITSEEFENHFDHPSDDEG